MSRHRRAAWPMPVVASISCSTARDEAMRLALLAPALVLMGALTAYPTVWVAWLAFQRRVPIFGIERFEGLGNFLFLAGDARFWNAARVTVGFALASVALEVVLGLGVALVLQ